MKVVVQSSECYLSKYFKLGPNEPSVNLEEFNNGSSGRFNICTDRISDYVCNFMENYYEFLEDIRTDPDFIKFVEDGYQDIENSKYSRFVKDSIFKTWFTVIEIPDDSQFFITQNMDIEDSIFDLGDLGSEDMKDDCIVSITDRVIYINEDGKLTFMGLSFSNLPAKGDKYE